MDYLLLLKRELDKQIKNYEFFADVNICTSYWDSGYDYGRIDSYKELLDFVNKIELYCDFEDSVI